jgi:hypothetical protein
MPLAIMVTGGVIVVVSLKPDGKFVEGDSLRLLGVALGFFYFPDETGLHTRTSLIKRGTGLSQHGASFSLNLALRLVKALHHYYISFHHISPVKCLRSVPGWRYYSIFAFLSRTWLVYIVPRNQVCNPANR